MRSPRNDFLISLSPSWSGSPFIPKWPPSLSPKDPVTSHSSQDRDLFTVFKIREDEIRNGNWSLDRRFPILMRKLRFSSTLLRIGWQIWLTLTYFEFWIVKTYCKLMMCDFTAHFEAFQKCRESKMWKGTQTSFQRAVSPAMIPFSATDNPPKRAKVRFDLDRPWPKKMAFVVAIIQTSVAKNAILDFEGEHFAIFLHRVARIEL